MVSYFQVNIFQEFINILYRLGRPGRQGLSEDKMLNTVQQIFPFGASQGTYANIVHL